MCIYIHIYIIQLALCIYIYIYIIRTYVHIYIYIYTYKAQLPPISAFHVGVVSARRAGESGGMKDRPLSIMGASTLSVCNEINELYSEVSFAKRYDLAPQSRVLHLLISLEY